MNARTCFDILCITRNATLGDAKESYKRLVKLWHPDQYVNFPEKQMVAQEKLKEINVAYRDIVTILKHNPPQNRTLYDEKDTQQQPGKRPLDKATFWNQVIRFIDTNILKSYHSEDTKKDTHSSSVATGQHGNVSVDGGGRIASPGAARHHNTVSIDSGGRTAPDFQQILKRTVRGKRFKTGGRFRNRHGNLKRGRSQFRNAASYRAESATKRSHGDRVEKIAPVGRVNRIGGD